jgi:hypothetical protein
LRGSQQTFSPRFADATRTIYDGEQIFPVACSFYYLLLAGLRSRAFFLALAAVNLIFGQRFRLNAFFQLPNLTIAQVNKSLPID